MKRLLIWLKDSSNRLWVKAAGGSVVALVCALLAALGNRVIPAGTLPSIELQTLDSLLSVIASSMLVVSTFSLSIMVAAFATASASATPRATELVIGDEGTQTAIASFISAFIFAIVAKTALGLGYYGPTGRFILFVGTLLVLTYLVVTLIRWVKTVSLLGRMANTLEKIEAAAAEAMRRHRGAPSLGAALAADAAPAGQAIVATEVGYLRQIDMAALEQLAAAASVQLQIRVRPGSLVYPGATLAVGVGAGALPDAAVRSAFSLGAARSFGQDPRFGLIVLSEVAQRALSPAVNDPGTAIAVMNSLARVLMDSHPTAADAAPRFEHLGLVPLDEDDFIQQSFDPIARDGAATVEVQIRMHKLLAAIAGQPGAPWAGAARVQARKMFQRGLAALTLPADKDVARQTFQRLHGGRDDQEGAAG